MSKLGDFLETVYGLSDGFKTLRASIRQSCNRKLADRGGSARLIMGKRKAQSDSTTQLEETRLSVWIELPDRLRIEAEHRNGDEAHCDVMYHPPRVPSPRPYLMLMYRWAGKEQNLWLYEAATVDPELDKFEWEHVVRQGRELRLSDPDVEGGRRGVVLEQAGTHVVIWSDIAREALLDLAASLVPASA
jgi:hypothetical protein